MNILALGMMFATPFLFFSSVFINKKISVTLQTHLAARPVRRFVTTTCMAALLFVCAAPDGICETPKSDNTLQVLHWWTSDSERKAATYLAGRLAEEGVYWQDVGVPGGAGIGAGKVLKSRVLSGNAPEVTQVIGASIRGWDELGFLLELDRVAGAGRWNTVFSPRYKV